MRVLITGCAGFIGGRLARRCLDEGFEVVGLDAFTDYYDSGMKRRNVEPLTGSADFSLHEADLRTVDLDTVLDGVDVVFHQAAQPGVRASWSDGFPAYVEHNVLATQRLLEAALRRELQRFVYASSSSVYGDVAEVPTAETASTNPASPYGVTKLAAEHLCGTYARAHGLPTVALRYFTVFGGGQRPDMACHRMIEAALDGAPFPLFGDGLQRRDLTHVDDVVSANLAATWSPLDPGEVLNIAGGCDANVLELIEQVGEAVGRPVPVQREPGQPGDVKRTAADTTRARRLLDFEPVVDLASGLSEQVAWHRRQRASAPA